MMWSEVRPGDMLEVRSGGGRLSGARYIVIRVVPAGESHSDIGSLQVDVLTSRGDVEMWFGRGDDRWWDEDVLIATGPPRRGVRLVRKTT